MTDTNKIKYSEKFRSLQGEGMHTGVPTVWLRLFACNLNCDGFGQDNPRDKSTYQLPYKDIDIKKINMIEDIPVLTKGCDSSYSWSAKFKHLQHEDTAENIVNGLVKLVNRDNLHSSFRGHRLRNPYHLCFTGGEPLLKLNQKAIVSVLKEYKKNHPNELPSNITFETNGTQLIGDDLLNELMDKDIDNIVHTLLSFSPKLFSVSGEPASRALKPEIIAKNIDMLGNRCDFQLKFVLNKDPQAWKEMENFLDKLAVVMDYEYVRNHVYIMPVGADKDSQENIAGDIADMAVSKGYKVSARVHAYLWNNPVGK